MSNEEAGVINDIQKRLVRVETKLDDLIEDMKAASAARDIARDAYLLANSAHEKIGEIKDNQKWLWRTTFGSMIAAVIAVFTKFKGG